MEVLPRLSSEGIPNILLDERANNSFYRNSAFHTQAHRAILSPETETVTVPPSTVAAPAINILPYLLMPLAGPEEFDLEVTLSTLRNIVVKKLIVPTGPRTAPRVPTVPPTNQNKGTRSSYPNHSYQESTSALYNLLGSRIP